MGPKTCLRWSGACLVAAAMISTACAARPPGSLTQPRPTRPSLTNHTALTRPSLTNRTAPLPGVLPSQARVADGRYLTTVALDGGTLTLVPAPKTVRPVLSQARAGLRFDSDEIAGTGAEGDTIFGFGLISVSSALTPGHVKIRQAPAWVGFVWGQAPIPCPISPPSPHGTPAFPDTATSYRGAVITGIGQTVLEYDSRGSPVCGGPISGPSVKPGMQHLSLPWRVESVAANDVTIEYRAPACTGIGPGGPAVGSSSEGQVTTIEVDLYAPFDTATCPPAWHSWPIGPVPDPTDLVHAPTGPIETSMTPGQIAVDP
jgi:hypothetical protein